MKGRLAECFEVNTGIIEVPFAGFRQINSAASSAAGNITGIQKHFNKILHSLLADGKSPLLHFRDKPGPSDGLFKSVKSADDIQNLIGNAGGGRGIHRYEGSLRFFGRWEAFQIPHQLVVIRRVPEFSDVAGPPIGKQPVFYLRLKRL